MWLAAAVVALLVAALVRSYFHADTIGWATPSARYAVGLSRGNLAVVVAKREGPPQPLGYAGPPWRDDRRPIASGEVEISPTGSLLVAPRPGAGVAARVTVVRVPIAVLVAVVAAITAVWMARARWKAASSRPSPRPSTPAE